MGLISKDKNMNTLQVKEIFTSISGEIGTIPQGAMTVFIRFQGCNLRCAYCDTPHTQAKEGGEFLTVDAILSRIPKGFQNFILTGGEPLLQDQTPFQQLCKNLSARGVVQVETNGTIIPNDLKNVDCWIFDYKFHSANKLNFEYFKHMDEHTRETAPTIWLKFPIETKDHCFKMLSVIEKITIWNYRIKFAASPIGVSPDFLFQFIQKHCPCCVLNIQLHKKLGFN